MQFKIICTRLSKASEHEDKVNDILDELHIDGYFNVKLDNFVTAGYGGYSKYQTESASITTTIHYGVK